MSHVAFSRSLRAVLMAAREKRQAALVPYLTAGDPHLGVTAELLHALSEGGADLIELGVPFSDPVADGPTLQAAAERALAQGVHLRGIFDMLSQARRDGLTTPVILFSYLNPLLQRHGRLEETFAEAKAAGCDGLLLVDVPLEAAVEPFAQARAAQLESISLCAPTTSAARRAQINALQPDAVYAIARLGITGAQQHLDPALGTYLEHLRQEFTAPLMVGFGVSTGEHVSQLREHVDGIVCGSALVGHLATVPDARKAEAAYAFMRALNA